MVTVSVATPPFSAICVALLRNSSTGAASSSVTCSVCCVPTGEPPRVASIRIVSVSASSMASFSPVTVVVTAACSRPTPAGSVRLFDAMS